LVPLTPTTTSTVAPAEVLIAREATVDADTTVDTTVISTTTTTMPPLPTIARPVRVVVTGDSTAEALGTGVVQWAAANPALAQADVLAAPCCGFVMGGERLWGDSMVSTSSCDGWPEAQLYPAVEQTTPDVVVVMSTTWDLIDRRWDGGETVTPGDADYRR